MIDVLQFLQQHNIPYRVKGVNVKRGEININCPFCADSHNPDPSFHLGIVAETGWYSCWRNRAEHKGKTLHRLIMKLLRCNYTEACTLLGSQPLWVNATEFDAISFATDPIIPMPTILNYPTEFFRLNTQWGHHQQFLNYLHERGFGSAQCGRVVHQYELLGCWSGRFKGRIIVPNRVQQQLVNWTGRSIYPRTDLRYLSLDSVNGALISIKDCVFNYDQLSQGGLILVVVEGPFDAIKLDFYGAKLGVRATCLFNKKATHAQLGFLGDLANVFSKIVVMFDAGETVDQWDLVNQLSWLPNDTITDWECPGTVKDPGELSSRAVKQLCATMKGQLL